MWLLDHPRMLPLNPHLMRLSAALCWVGCCLGCGTEQPSFLGGQAARPPMPVDLRFNEIVSNNAGVWIDERGEADDYIEIINAASEPRDLGQYVIGDSSAVVELPRITLAPNQIVLLWADGHSEQGVSHLGLKVSAQGEALTLRRHNGTIVDQVNVPPLAAHHAYQRMPDALGPFADCGWATPARLNGDTCGPPPVPDLPEQTTYAPYTWPSPWPPLPRPIMLTELALRPASFIELLNTTDQTLDLSQYQVTLAAHGVGYPWPSLVDGVQLAWPRTNLGPHERLVVPVSSGDIADIAATTTFEGVATLWNLADATAIDRKDFSRFPDNASLARVPDPDGPFRFCTNTSPNRSNDECQPLAQRAVGDHVRDLSTPNDFAALSNARGTVGAAAVEFIVDMQSGDEVTLLNSANWDLHFIFIREVIDRQPHLDRCTLEGLNDFNNAWMEFSIQQYLVGKDKNGVVIDSVATRRYLLGNLVKYAGTNIQTVEFTSGDYISSQQMLRAFNAVLRHVDDPTKWALRPQVPRQGDPTSQVARARQIEGQLPIVDQNAPFRDLTFQPLVPTVGYGTLRYLPSDSIADAELGPRDIVVTDGVPLDIPFVAGLITEAFQTPLAHVNVLSRGRGTPNMGLSNARDNPLLKPLFGKLVRLEVRSSDFLIEEANNDDAVAFWNSRKPQGPAAVPRMDTSVRGLQPLSAHSIADIPSIGGKAAQLAELGRVGLCAIITRRQFPVRMPRNSLPPQPQFPARIPSDSFAIPVVYSLEHFEKSGAKARLARYLRDSAFNADPKVREQRLSAVRADILATPIDAELLRTVRAQMSKNWPGQRVRFRSSSNTEDLPHFNGAGLYISTGVNANASDEEVATEIRTVWASLWRLRAYDEREYYNIDQNSVAMAVLVQEAFPSEAANGVAISRDILEPSNQNAFYINAQAGEALVTNPAPGVVSDQFTYTPSNSPPVAMHSRSSLTDGDRVLSDTEVAWVYCSLRQIHDHFRPLLDPNRQNPWFAMDIEFKFIGPDRQLVIKQARPFSFGQEAPLGWCDFY
jgi:hypothetical protein